MKKIVVLVCLFACAAGMVPAQARRGGTMFVATQNLELRSATGFFASTNATLEYGAQVSVLQIQGDWAEVHSSDNPLQRGWTRINSLTARRIVPGSTANTTAQEVALAGKGFDQEIENAHRARGDANYPDVDRVEAQHVPSAALRRFLEEGRLSLGDR